MVIVASSVRCRTTTSEPMGGGWRRERRAANISTATQKPGSSVCDEDLQRGAFLSPMVDHVTQKAPFLNAAPQHEPREKTCGKCNKSKSNSEDLTRKETLSCCRT